MPKLPTVQTLFMNVRPDLILFSLLLGACSGAEFAGSSASSATDGNDQKNTEQPSDVAGGFGLTCDPSYKDAAPESAIISCKFSSADDKKFAESESIKLTFEVKNGATKLDVTTLSAGEPHNFKFETPKVEVPDIMIIAIFINPKDNTVLADKSAKITAVLTSQIDTADNGNGNGNGNGSPTPADDDPTGNQNPPPAGDVAPATMTPDGGAFLTAQTVTLASSTPNSTIHYTIDGTDPNCSSTLYSAPVNVSANLRLRAIACASGMNPSTITGKRYLFTCGESGNGCYDISNLQNLSDGSSLKIIGTSTSIKYVKADSACTDTADSRCFRVWQDTTSTKILNASGVWSSSNTWQKSLNADGNAKSSSYFSQISQLAGRACPKNVYINDTNKFATGQCMYYSNSISGNYSQYHQTLNSGGKFRSLVCPPYSGKWYHGNVAACSGLGMRLLTLYETAVSDFGPLDFSTVSPYPTEDSNGALPTASGSAGIPADWFGSWTATLYRNPEPNYCASYFVVNGYQDGVLRARKAFTLPEKNPIICGLPQ
jgi:hypothetical protein